MADFKRNIYLKSADLDTVRSEYFKIFKENHLEEESVEVIHSLNRVTSESVFAKVSSPHYNASAMDGIVVRARDTFHANDINPIQLKLGVDFHYIDTGDDIPSDFDSVIMIENVVVLDEETVEIFEAVYPWQDVRPVGEDIAVLEMIVPQSCRIRPVDIGAMLAGGVTHIKVIKRMKVGIIPTGSEIVDPGTSLEAGDIIESNTRVLEALLESKGMIPHRYDIVKDDYDLLKAAIEKAVEENDMVLINAGSSAGSEDYTSTIIGELGTVYYHGINIKPGKPAILSSIAQKPIIGIPGYPVSAFIVYEKVVDSLINQFYSQQDDKQTVKAKLSRRVMSSLKNEEFVRVKLGKVSGTMIASPLNRGAGVTMSLVRADGILRIPKHIEGLEAGTDVDIELMDSRGTIDHTIVSIGSHDIVLDILTDELSAKHQGLYLSSSHQGSFAGVMAMKNCIAHIAPSHLLDEKTGIYNISFIEKYLGKGLFSLVKGVKRKQGLYVKKDNPKNIKGIEDLVRDDIIFVNRQKGSGTRVLLDFLLKNNKISPKDISGYQREMNTHTTVAAAVLSGTADVAMGIYSVADALNLDFIPLGDEDYDFIIKNEDIDTENIQAFLSVLKSETFRKKVEAMKGYQFEQTGEIIKV